ncbi:MAG: putative regulator protein [Actinomycetia bacterium]|nr:putative regulator protein [Actinomycetes bacterium]
MIGVQSGMSASGIQDVTWKKSRRSNPSGNCVEIAELADGAIAVRDSRQQAGPALIYSRTEIGVLISRARAGGLDRPVG